MTRIIKTRRQKRVMTRHRIARCRPLEVYPSNEMIWSSTNSDNPTSGPFNAKHNRFFIRIIRFSCVMRSSALECNNPAGLHYISHFTSTTLYMGKSCSDEEILCSCHSLAQNTRKLNSKANCRAENTFCTVYGLVRNKPKHG